MTTQDRGLKFLEKGKDLFNNKNFSEAITCFDKVLAATNQKLFAIAHYNKGLALLNLRNKKEGILHIDKAVSLDPSYHMQAIKLISQLGKLR
jgi:tetratricopeptide (TPR) repeat protein